MILEVCWDGIWTLSFGLSQFHGHGSWLVCKVAPRLWMIGRGKEPSDVVRLELNTHVQCHNIIYIHNIVVQDWQYSAKYFSHSIWMWKMFCRISPVPHNTIMDMNNVMVKVFRQFTLKFTFSRLIVGQANSQIFKLFCKISLRRSVKAFMKY